MYKLIPAALSVLILCSCAFGVIKPDYEFYGDITANLQTREDVLREMEKVVPKSYLYKKEYYHITTEQIVMCDKNNRIIFHWKYLDHDDFKNDPIVRIRMGWRVLYLIAYPLSENEKRLTPKGEMFGMYFTEKANAEIMKALMIKISQLHAKNNN